MQAQNQGPALRLTLSASTAPAALARLPSDIVTNTQRRIRVSLGLPEVT